MRGRYSRELTQSPKRGSLEQAVVLPRACAGEGSSLREETGPKLMPKRSHTGFGGISAAEKSVRGRVREGETFYRKEVTVFQNVD